MRVNVSDGYCDALRKAGPGGGLGGQARQRLAASGFETWPDRSPAAAEALLRTEIARWTPIVKASGAKAD